MSQTAFWDKLQEAGLGKKKKKKDRRENMAEREEREDPLALRRLFNYSNGRCPSALVLSAWFEY